MKNSCPNFCCQQCFSRTYCSAVQLFEANDSILSQVLREDGGFDYKKAIVESILILIREIPDAKESGLAHLCEFIEARTLPTMKCFFSQRTRASYNVTKL